jgi:hypothetical protein
LERSLRGSLEFQALNVSSNRGDSHGFPVLLVANGTILLRETAIDFDSVPFIGVPDVFE